MAELDATLPPAGWINDPAQVGSVLASLPRPLFADAAPHLGGSGTDKTTLLYKAFRDANGGSYIPYPAQTIGDCVSHGFGHGIDLLEAVQIATGHQRNVLKQTATEAIYGMARVDIGDCSAEAKVRWPLALLPGRKKPARSLFRRFLHPHRVASWWERW